MSENYVIITEQPVYVNIPVFIGSSMFGKGGGKMELIMTDKDEKVYFIGSSDMKYMSLI